MKYTWEVAPEDMEKVTLQKGREVAKQDAVELQEWKKDEELYREFREETTGEIWFDCEGRHAHYPDILIIQD